MNCREKLYNSENVSELLKYIKHDCMKNNFDFSQNKDNNVAFDKEFHLTEQDKKHMLMSLTEKDFIKSEMSNKEKYNRNIVHIFKKKFFVKNNIGEKEIISVYFKLRIKNNENFRSYVISLHESAYERKRRLANNK